MLCVVGLGNVLTKANLTGIWLQLTGNELHKGRFTSTVRTNKRYMISSIQLEINVIVDKVILVRFSNTLKRNNGISGTWGLWEPKMHVMRLLWKNYQLFTDLLDLCNALLNLLSLGWFIPKPLNEGFHMSNVALLSCTFSAKLLKIFFSLMKVARIVAGIRDQHTILKCCNMSHASIHKRTIVAYQQNRSVI